MWKYEERPQVPLPAEGITLSMGPIAPPRPAMDAPRTALMISKLRVWNKKGTMMKNTRKSIATSLLFMLLVLFTVTACGDGGGGGGNQNDAAVWDHSNWDEKNWQ